MKRGQGYRRGWLNVQYGPKHEQIRVIHDTVRPQSEEALHLLSEIRKPLLYSKVWSDKPSDLTERQQAKIRNHF